ncbi:hypothetical protein CASFOL_005409 [Castilleja foliolosa]|uniref:Protein SLOW GREEN 1, chloroplastic n=1 Tax=Castilleja foliolosa TaxID=1961234 RepID=A0ABD3E4G1_9LAMI
MEITLSINPSFSTPLIPPPTPLRTSSVTRILRPPRILFSHKNLNKNLTTITAAASSHHTLPNPSNPFIYPLKAAAACTIIFAATAFGKFPHLPARAETFTVSKTLIEEVVAKGEEENSLNSPLTQLLESKPEAIDALKKLLQEKLESGEDEESLSILRKLSSAQPDNFEWKFLIARVLNETGKIEEARDAFESILAQNPLSFEALFENALLMDRSGERDLVINRLEQALRVAEDENKVKEARDVKLIMAQMQFLHKNVEEALMSYEELEKEDPSDFRPYFCKGMIFSLMDKNDEAREQFAKYKELSPKKFDVEGYLRTPLSRMKLFGTGDEI